MFDNAARLNLLFNNKLAINCTQDNVPRLNIPDNVELVLSLDPSSSQTGFVLGDCLGNVYLIGDYINYGKTLNKFEYAGFLKNYLKLLTENYPITYFVYEVPFTPGAQDLAAKVLSFMESTFKTYSQCLTGLRKENSYPILPSVWRKTYFNKKEYVGRKKDRENLKLLAQEEAVLRFPVYSDYFLQSNIPDSTDALGVYYGFLSENWEDYSKGIYRVSKANSRYNRNHASFSKVTLNSHEVLRKFMAGPHRLYYYNKEYSLEDTIAIVTSQTNDVCIVFAMDNISRNLLVWDSDVLIADKDNPLLLCWRKNV